MIIQNLKLHTIIFPIHSFCKNNIIHRFLENILYFLRDNFLQLLCLQVHMNDVLRNQKNLKLV